MNRMSVLLTRWFNRNMQGSEAEAGALIGEAGAVQSQPGDPQPGDPQPGDPQPSDPQPGDPQPDAAVQGEEADSLPGTRLTLEGTKCFFIYHSVILLKSEIRYTMLSKQVVIPKNTKSYHHFGI